MIAPRVSVCIPAYNGAAFLKDCLGSISTQSFSDYEVIIVDDCSTDDTREICLTYAESDPRVRYVRNAVNLGLVGNWNRCIQLSAGTWIKFLFQDDLLRPNALTELVEAGEANKSRLVFGRRVFNYSPEVDEERRRTYDREIELVSRLFPATGSVTAHDFSKLVLSHPRNNIVGEPVAVLLRRDSFEALGPFHPDIAIFCDMEYWARIGTQFGVTHVASTVAEFLVHPHSTTSRTMANRSLAALGIDHVVLLHEYAFGQHYGTLRRFSDGAGVDLEERFHAIATWTRGQAIRIFEESHHTDTWAIDTLKELEGRYPELRRHFRRTRWRHEVGQVVGRMKRLFAQRSA